MIQRIYHSIKSVLDPFRYNNLEDKDTISNFSLIDAMRNNTGTYLVGFPGSGFFFPPIFPELCTICF